MSAPFDAAKAGTCGTSPVGLSPVPRSILTYARSTIRGLGHFGPGIVAGASDNDPTTVATLAVVGSTTGFELLWLVLLLLPMLVTVQVTAASVATVTGRSLEELIRARFGRSWAGLTLFLVLAVNIVTLAADLEGGAAALAILTGTSYQWFLAPLAAVTGLLLVVGTYEAIESVLRPVLLIFISYVVVTFLVRPNWLDVIRHTVVPEVHLSGPFLAGGVAILGTTLTSYAYVWETIEVSEQRTPLRRLGTARLDAGVGMGAACIVFYFIIVGTGATLGAHQQHVETASDAAQALGPLAGHLAPVVFAIGLLASSLMALPVLAGTSAYVVCQALGWRGALSVPVRHARRFYAVVIGTLLLALTIGALGITPINLLVGSSIAGALGTPLTLCLLMLIARDRSILGARRVSRGVEVSGWVTAVIVTLACLAFLAQSLLGRGSCPPCSGTAGRDTLHMGSIRAD